MKSLLIRALPLRYIIGLFNLELLNNFRLRTPRYGQALFEIRRTPFRPLALVAFGYVFHLAVFEKGLHFDLAPAGTKKLLRGF
jgi:hypothetical protein